MVKTMKKNRLSLNDVEWGEFRIGDVFDVSGTITTHPSSLNKPGKFPRITCAGTNNGLDDFYNNTITETGGVLTVDSATDGYIFYQNNDFLATDHVEKISMKNGQKMSKEIGLFVKTAIENSKDKKYGYGYKFSQSRINKQKISLPIDNLNNPNWKFMEDYIKQEQRDIAQKIVSYYEQKMLETGFDLVGLEDLEWKQFRLNEIFNIYTGRDIIISKVKNGIYPIITHSIENNGIGAFSEEINNRKLFNYENTISLADRGNFHAYVQSHDFYIGTRVKALELKESINDTYLLKFLCMSINKQKVRFSYGFNATNNVDNIIIILPADKNGNPHWEYMSKFMQKLEAEKLEKVLDYIYIYIYRLAVSRESELVGLYEKEWKEFWLEDIVDIKSGVRLTKANQNFGKIPFIGSTDNNNGVTNFVSNINNSLDKNVLGVNYNGSVVENFYHPYECIFSDDVKRIKWKNEDIANKYTYLFLKQLILQQKEKYAYGYKFNGARMNRQKIFLPVDDNDNPDYDYMKKYMQIQEIKKYYDLISYYQSQI